MLLLVSVPVETGEARVAEPVREEMAERLLPEEHKTVSVVLDGDGKTIRSTGKMDSYESPLHIISAQLCELGITPASRSTDGKSSEIPAVQDC